jgi:hypothetical protein
MERTPSWSRSCRWKLSDDEKEEEKDEAQFLRHNERLLWEEGEDRALQGLGVERIATESANRQ